MGAIARFASAWYADSRGFDPHVWQHSFVEFVHEINSTAILSFLRIQGGSCQLLAKECALQYSAGKENKKTLFICLHDQLPFFLGEIVENFSRKSFIFSR